MPRCEDGLARGVLHYKTSHTCVATRRPYLKEYYMRVIRGPVLIAALGLAVGVTAGAAQDRGGFFFGIGAGYGSNWISCSEPAATCASTTQANGFAGFFKIGAHLNETFGVAFETNSWFGSVESSDLWQSNWSGVVYFYPGGGNLMLRGGLGLATAEFSFPVGLTSVFSTETGFGATVGVGYDFPIGFVAVLNPVVNLNYGNYGTITTTDGTVTGVSTLVLQLAVGLTFQ
jgi:hypothetical protein